PRGRPSWGMRTAPGPLPQEVRNVRRLPPDRARPECDTWEVFGIQTLPHRVGEVNLGVSWRGYDPSSYPFDRGRRRPGPIVPDTSGHIRRRAGSAEGLMDPPRVSVRRARRASRRTVVR